MSFPGPTNLNLSTSLKHKSRIQATTVLASKASHARSELTRRPFFVDCRSLPRNLNAVSSLSIVAFPKNSKLNPHMRLLYSALGPHEVNAQQGSLRVLATTRYEVVHYHWPERFLNRPSLYLRCRGLARFALEMLIIRLKRARVVWTIQNIKGHEERNSVLSGLFRQIFFRNLKGFISLSETVHKIALETYPVLKWKRSIVAS